METLSFLVDLSWVIGLGALVTSLFQRFKQPLILGYLLTGLLLASPLPYLPHLSNPGNIQLLAQLGLVFIMFFLGLEFNLHKLKEIGGSALLAAVLELSLVAWLGFILARFLGFPVPQSLFFGAIFCISSTTIIVKSLSDGGTLKEDFASLIIGILLVEDVAAVVMLVLLSGLASGGEPSLGQALEAVARVVAFSAGAVGLGLAVVPRFLRWLNRAGGGETLTISAIGISLGLSVLASSLGVSTALGAFLSGAIMAESGVQQKLQEKLSSVRDLFLAVFFVTVGLQFEFVFTREILWLAAAALATVLVGKAVANTLASSLVGYDFRTSARVGLGMAQVGEFSFIIATLGLTARIVPAGFFSAAVMVSTLTAFTTPYLIRGGGPLAEKVERSLPLALQTYLKRYQSWVQALSWPLRRLKMPSVLYPLAGRVALLILLMAGAVAANRWVNRFLASHQILRVVWEGDASIFWWWSGWSCRGWGS
jgi:CPA2 family monovalent cation:H+ antiporter-2